MNKKKTITNTLLSMLPESEKMTEDLAMKTWWANIRRDGGLRLTDLGYEIMHDVLGLESWQLDLADQERQIFTKRLILGLDRKLEWPYYIEVSVKKKRRRIVFFGSREAMMASMYGDLQKWVDSLG